MPAVEVEIKPGGEDKGKGMKGEVVAGMIGEAKASGKLQALEDFIMDEPMLSEFSAEEVALVLPEVFPGKSVDECVKAMQASQSDLEKVVAKLEEMNPAKGEAAEEEDFYAKSDKMSAEE